ncbi:MAG: glycosyltransferase family 87 protein [Pseudomonadota bacterium]
MKRIFPWLLLACVLAYGWQALGPWRARAWAGESARDFASYYYAVQVAAAGGDPYATKALGKQARAEGTRKSVHPFFYPPPFLAAFAWVLPFSLESAYHAWYWAEHLFLLAVLLALGRWVPDRGMALTLGLLAATFSPIADNAWMGQANLVVLAVTVPGVLLAERGWEKAGGALVGLACMLKMSPALLVAWWLLHRRWRPALAAVLAAVFLSVAALPLADIKVQWAFFTEVLPGFAAGRYHGLTVPITLTHNHSIPSLLHEVLGGGKSTTLLPAAGWISRIVTLAVLGGLAWCFRHRPTDPLDALCQAGAVVVPMLVLPVYTYEHHMVWMLVPYAAAFAALRAGRLPRGWWVALVLAYAIQALPLDWLKALYPHLRGLGSLRDFVYYPLRESKFVAALVVGIACALASRPGAERPAA